MPIISKSSNFKCETQHYVVKLPKSAGASTVQKLCGYQAPLAPVLNQALTENTLVSIYQSLFPAHLGVTSHLRAEISIRPGPVERS